ncbi:ATP-dependent DNA ligase [Kineococcus sp. T13]|uniref:DNA polymerase domain-containing protein n=1 Tax=Kineococcus vitellinus TaxID=2696565 RepID=UPI0014137469|nr:DNA primase small subunit domain-containing protein [Kineococcus vitellinus]NAZ77069.1 ATP-dependent DNA ligase [Kineococcus vitellinus]
MAPGAPAEELDVDGVAVRLTSPDKAYYPQLGPRGTKRAVVEHYRLVAAALLEAVRDRPTYLQRFPDGTEGEEVYQKRVPRSAPPFVHTVRITFPSGRSADALRPTSTAAIVWGAQQSTITFHPWHCTAPDVDHPDELRVDLDPQPGTGFAQAREVAREVLHPLLAELGLEGSPKTSGGRGLHVFASIEPRWSFTEVRRAAIALAREVERRAGGRVTTAWWKEERGAQVFVDYNQNARDRTIASAYSLRRTPRATVSAPLTWAELDTDVDPDDLTLTSFPERFAAVGDLWAGRRARTGSLEALLELAARDEAGGLGDLPYPPNHPKVAGEPKRVQPSRDRDRER